MGSQIGYSQGLNGAAIGGAHNTAPTDFSPLSISTATPLGQPANGTAIYISGGQWGSGANTAGVVSGANFWGQWNNLPAYLSGNGKICSTWINETNTGTWTTTLPCRLWLLRNPSWNVVSLTGFTSYSTGNNFGFDSNTTVYYQDYAPGTYSYQNNSAMYVWDYTYVNGVSGGGLTNVSSGSWAGYLYANQSSTTALSSTLTSNVQLQRFAIDPFDQGNITYSITSGSLPPGFSLNSSTGTVSGAYTNQGINTDGQVYSFTITAYAANGIDSSSKSYTMTMSVPYIYQQMITRSYMASGYQNSALWSNINRVPHATNTAANLGDGSLSIATHYKSGGNSDTYGYIVGAGTGGAYNTTLKYNLRTETNVGTTTAPGYAPANTGTMVSGDRTKMYNQGDGTSNVQRFTFSNDTYASIGTFASDHTSAAWGQYIGMFWTNGSGNRRITFSTDTLAGGNGTYGSYGQQKGMSSKVGGGYGFAGNAGTYNGGYTFNKINLTTTSDSGAGTGNKQVQNSGEENLGMGQAYGYMIGNYNGNQNNLSGVYNYSTDVGSETDGALQPQGHGGASSGLCWHRD